MAFGQKGILTMTNKMVLILELADGVLYEDLATDINAEILCRLEEDDKLIKSWEWIYGWLDKCQYHMIQLDPNPTKGTLCQNIVLT